MKKKLYLAIVGVIAVQIGYVTNVAASNHNLLSLDDLLALNLENLLNVETSIASKSNSKIGDTPSSVTVFTKQEIRNLGVTTLEELLNYVPGFQVGRTEEDGTKVNTVFVRGRRSVHDAPEVLFLVDGQRLNGSQTGGALIFNNNMTLDNIKQVEIIRGPGSALYGSNAFMGVVSIITDKTSSEAGYRQGTLNSSDTYVQLSKQSYDEDWNVSLFVRNYSDDGSRTELPDIFFGGEISTKDPIEAQDLYLSVSWKMITLNVRHAERHQRDFSQFARVSDGRQRDDVETTSYNLKASVINSDSWGIDLNASYIRNERDGIGVTFPVGIGEAFGLTIGNDAFIGGGIIEGVQISAGVDARYTISESSEILFGTDWREEKIEKANFQNNFDASELFDPNPSQTTSFIIESPASEAGTREIASFYTQYKGSTSIFTYYAGFRFDRYSDFGSNVSPRAALIAEVIEDGSLKLLYGEAFRAPSFRELTNRDLAFVGNRELDPEIAKTAELAWVHRVGDALQYSITFFDTEIENGFQAIPADPKQLDFDPAGFGTLSIENSASLDLQGIEAEILVSLLKGLTVKANYTEILDLPEDPQFASKSQYSLITNYQKDKFNFNLSAYGYSESEHVLGEELDSYVVVNGSVRYQFSDNITLSLNGLNLANEDYVTNTLSNDFTSGLPARGRMVTIGIQFELD